MADLARYRPLRLTAEDQDDLKVMSACLQDCVLKLGDLAFVPKDRRFAFVANRFVWECAGAGESGRFARVRTGAHFNDVLSVKQLNLRADAKDAVIELLAIRFEAGSEGAGTVVLDFAGGGAIRLDVEAVNAQLSDLSEPWRTRSKPAHKE